MLFKQHALDLASRGFWVFPLIEGGKTPLQSGWQALATRDPDAIAKLWSCPVTDFDQPLNIGIFTGRFGDSQSLLVVDIDNKNGKSGSDTFAALIQSRVPFPVTAESITPTGGRHVFFLIDFPIKQSVGALGEGLDTRSRGGYVVGAGSVTPKGDYKWLTTPPILQTRRKA